MNVLYLFAGRRKQDEEKYRQGAMPDTYLVGLNRLAQHGIAATYIENRFSELLRRVSFNLANLPSLFAAGKYAIVFSGTNPVLVFLHKALMRNQRTKWVIYNTFLTNMLKRNQGNLAGKLVRASLWRTVAIIHPSTVQRDFLVQQGFPKEQQLYLPYGVDREFVDRHRGRPTLVKTPYIMSAGKDMGRDYQTLVDAVRGLDVQLYIGASPRNFADVKNIPDNVHISFYTPADLVTMYEHAAFVVIPTHREDQLDSSDCSGQYVLLESMMSGKAVIASDRSTIYDYVTPDTHAVLVEPENAQALRSAIQKLLDEPERAERLGKAARAKAEEEFTTERFSAGLADIFKKLHA